MDYTDDRMRSKVTSYRSAIKSSGISQNGISRFTSQQNYKRHTLLPSTIQNNDWNFLQARKQSQLNSMYNVRKHKLDEITKANYDIYSRINSQQSHYTKKNNTEKFNPFKGPNSRFYTIQEMNQHCEQSRKVLGPIGNFKALQPPSITLTENVLDDITICKLNKKMKSISSTNMKTKKKLKNLQEGLPSIYQFY